MEATRDLGCDLQDFRQSLARERGIEGVIDLFLGHASGQAFENQQDGQPGAANGERSAQEVGVVTINW